MLIAPNQIRPPEPITGRVKLAPAYAVLTSMILLEKMEDSVDLGDWVLQTTNRLAPKMAERLTVLVWGFGHESLANGLDIDTTDVEFPVYLDRLKSADPVQLRDRIWQNMRHSSHLRVVLDAPTVSIPDNLLDNKQAYVTFFTQEFKKLKELEAQVNHHVFEQAYDLLVNPAALQAFLADHLGELWQTYVAEEWGRIRPLLQDVVDAFAQQNLEGLPVFEMIQKVTRRDLRTIFKEDELLKFRQIVFIPSVHNGPYIIWSGREDTLCLTFSAHIPEGASSRSASELNQTELLNRLKALADEKRIKILDLLREEELSTQDIMERLQLSKSAASRHLRQLRANSLIDEIRADDGVKKFYRLNQENGEKTLSSLAGLLQPDN